MKIALHQTGIACDSSGYDANAPCPLCAEGGAKSAVFTVGSFDIVRCPGCDLMYLLPMPGHDVLEGIYREGYYRDPQESYGYFDYRGARGSVQATYRKRLAYITQVTKGLRDADRLRVHEVGAALGFGVQEVARLLPGADISASDVSPEAVAACSAAGLAAYPSDPFGRPVGFTGRLDLVYAFDVIEHISQPRVFVEWVENVLEPGGFVAVTTPDMTHPINRLLGKKSPSIKVPQHVCYYSQRTLAKLFGERFTLLGSTWDYQVVSAGFLLSRIFHILQIRQEVSYHGPSLVVPNGMKIFVFRKNR